MKDDAEDGSTGRERTIAASNDQFSTIAIKKKSNSFDQPSCKQKAAGKMPRTDMNSSERGREEPLFQNNSGISTTVPGPKWESGALSNPQSRTGD
ncbi:unnamed protein product [Gongylonema pulchrum]|uniref:Uncharacterized protein n=1 Tax=Gongylonema pulchrum TaxID=637853 RepID=A0A183CUC7_9BILA|nr:unnamed protein product [Gongylonema pulchrum]